MQFQKQILPNGLRVLTISMPSFQSVTVMVMVKAGSRYETRQNNGISHFFEHMSFKGTKKRPSAMEIASLIDGIGGEFSAFTSKETTGFYVKSSKNHIDLCLDVLSDMLQNSKLDQKEIDKERGVILEEINLYEDTPIRKIGDVYERLLYGDNSMGWDIAGGKDVIKKIQREDFIKYFESLYSANNITVVVAGGTDPKKAQILVEKFFRSMKRFKTINFKKVKNSQKKPQVLVKTKKTEQTQIALGIRTVAIDHPDKYALSVLAGILGGGMSSRLFHEVREKRGLAYYVRTHADFYEDSGSLVSLAGVDSKRIDEAIEIILEEYQKIANADSIPHSELEKAKEYLKGHMVLELEDSRSVAGFYAQQELLEKKIENPEKVIEEIKKIKSEDIIKVAKKYFVNANLNLAVIGDFPSGQRFENLLKL